MATINFGNRQITTKVVYFGAAGAGCNTNVRKLYELVSSHRKSQLHQFGPGSLQEKTFYFDYIPETGPDANGFEMRYRIYSLPGGLDFAAHRDEVMKNTDGIVFVADARRPRSQANLDSLFELEQTLATHNAELAVVPVVIQVNHTDAEDARDAEEVAFDLNPYGFPVIEGVASETRGVLETHLEIATATSERIRENMAGNDAAVTLTAVHELAEEAGEDVIRGHIARIQQQTAEARTALADGTPSMPPTAEVEVPFQPRDLVGFHPSQVISSQIEGNRIVLDVALESMSGGDTRRLSVVLVNRPTDTPAVPRHSPPVVDGGAERVREYLPDTIEFKWERAPAYGPYWYGVVGVVGGILIGLLLSLLVYLFGLVP